MEEPPGRPPPPRPFTRRAHLDSASYRTLNRLFSLFLNVETSNHGPTPSEAEPVAANLASDSSELPPAPPACKDAGFDRAKGAVGEENAAVNPNLGGSHHGPTPSEAERVAADPSGDAGGVLLATPACKVAGFDRAEGAEDEVNAAVSPNLEGFSGKSGAVGEELGRGAGSVGEDEALRFVKACLDGEDERLAQEGVRNDEENVAENSNLEGSCGKSIAVGEELRFGVGSVGEDEASRSVKACLDGEDEKLVEEGVRNDKEQLLLDEKITGLSGMLDGIDGGAMPTQICGVWPGEVWTDEAAEQAQELGGGVGDDSPEGNLDHGRVDGGGFEEGEIEGDTRDLDVEALNLDPEDEAANDGKLDDVFVSGGSGENEARDHDSLDGSLSLCSKPENNGSGDLVPMEGSNVRDDAPINVARVPAVSYEDVVAWNEAPLPIDEASKLGKKRKRVLTAERKAQKTKTKRIKRAQQRIAQGVKRLKLQPIIKPKVVQYCHFYLQGKCEQGNICKYSHDTTPLTKSKPCTHFARGSCLKGDDCPYDHELSKYPCHNFLENGICVRGDKCKFSHAMPTAEGPSLTPDAKKCDTPLGSEHVNVREQKSCQKTSMVYNGKPVTSAPTKRSSILNNLANISANAQRVPAQIPKGVRFLPFSKEESDTSSPHQGALPTEEHRNTKKVANLQNLVGLKAEGQKIAGHNKQRSIPAQDNKNSLKQDAGSGVASGSGNIQDEVSEASRILQEFLFGTGS